jgi:hypothetical protein
MATLLQKPGAEVQMSVADRRNITLLTILSKLVMALMMGIVAIIVLLMG